MYPEEYEGYLSWRATFWEKDCRNEHGHLAHCKARNVTMRQCAESDFTNYFSNVNDYFDQHTQSYLLCIDDPNEIVFRGHVSL